MNNTEYACAVATVRAKEAELSGQPFFEQLLTAPSFEAAKQLMYDRGFSGYDKAQAVTEPLDGYMTETWDFLRSIAPQKEKLDFLVVRNDFHNLKAAIKAAVADSESSSLFIRPSLVGTDDILKAVKEKNFEILPEWLSETAKKGYELLTSTMSGQLFDMLTDSAAFNAEVKLAKNTSSPLAERIAELDSVCADAKTAYRMARLGADDTLAEYSLNGAVLNRDALFRAAQKGENDVSDFLIQNGYSFLAESHSLNDHTFERVAENAVTSLLDEARFTAFGIEPLIAYYFARAAEYKNLRMIMNAKHAGLGEEVIRERLRALYV